MPPSEPPDGQARPADLSPRLVLPAPPRALGGRLHLAGLFLSPLAQALPVGLLILTGRFPVGLAVSVVCVSVAVAAARWLRFSWCVEQGALVIEQGVITRQRRVIPLERIQRVDLSRSLRHRLLGAVELRVEAIGGGETEGRLDALSPAVATELRRVLLARERAPTAASPDTAAPPTLARVGPRMLVVAGLTGGRVGVVAALLGGADQLFGGRILSQGLGRVPDLGAALVLLLATIGAGAVFLLAVVATVVTNWGFTLSAEGSSLRIRRGLLQQRLDTVPRRRVQAVRVEENIVRRRLRLGAVTVEVAGQVGEDAADTNVLLPIGSRAAALGLVETILDAPGCSRVPLTPMPRRARRLRVARALMATVVVTVLGGVLAWPWGLAAALLGVPLLLLALGAYRALGWAQVGGLLVVRSGVLVRRTAFVPVDRLQALSLRAGPARRRLGLAALTLHVARAPRGRDPEMIDLAVDDAHRLLAELSQVRAIVHP